MIKNSIAYFYYRCYQLYNGSLRSDGPLAFMVGFNGSFLINLAIQILVGIHLIQLQGNLAPMLIVVDGAVVLVSIIITPFVVRSKRKFFNTKVVEFKGEPIERRKKNSGFVVFYVVLSIILLLCSVIL